VPETLNKTEVAAGINAVKGKVQACGDAHPDLKGMLKVKLTINGAGKVAGATADGEQAGTALGGCVIAAIKQATFPKSQRGITVNYPFVFR
jgi:hypothetical protein